MRSKSVLAAAVVLGAIVVSASGVEAFFTAPKVRLPLPGARDGYAARIAESFERVAAGRPFEACWQGLGEITLLLAPQIPASKI